MAFEFDYTTTTILTTGTDENLVLDPNGNGVVSTLGNIDVTGNIIVSGTVDGVDLANVLTTTEIPATEQSELAAIDALAAGMVAKTADATYSNRTLTGTTNRITVTNGDGVSGNPTFDIGTDVVTTTGTETLTNKTINGLQIKTLTASTTDATPTEAADAATYVDVPSDSTILFTVHVVARRTDVDGESAGYKLEGVIDNNAGTTALVGTVTTALTVEDTAAWDVTATADDTNDRLAITVTGEAAKSIDWKATVIYNTVTG